MGKTKRLSYEIYLKNLKNTDESPKRITPIKKIYVDAKDALSIKLDPKTLEEYGDKAQQNIVFRQLLSNASKLFEDRGSPVQEHGVSIKKTIRNILFINFYK